MATHRPTSPGSESTKPAKGLTDQQRTIVGVSALMLCLLVGGGIIYWFLFGTTPKQRTVTVDPAQQTPDIRGGMRLPPRRPPTQISQDGENRWTARGNTGSMRVTRDGANHKLDLYYHGRDFLPGDQVSLVAGYVRAIRDEAMAREWSISADQITRLRKIQIGTASMTASDAERAELRQLFDAYRKAGDGQPKAEAEKKLLGRLDEIAKSNLDASRKAMAQRLEQVKQILTPEQIEKIAAR